MLIIDEFDTIKGGPLIYILGELRCYCPSRPKSYPNSIILCGMRDLRDYKDESGNEAIGRGSPFNIKDISIRTRNWLTEDVRNLYNQYEEEYGNKVNDEVIERIMYWTDGQP